MEPFQIGAREIDVGRPGDCRGCPVALAIDFRLLPCYFAEVFNTGIVIRKREGSVQVAGCSIPSELETFIRQIDTCDDDILRAIRETLPFKFELPALSPGLFA